MTWKLFEKQMGMNSRYAKYHDKIAVIITKAGTMLLTNAADKALGGPRAVHLLSDPANGKFGVSPADGADAYKISRAPKGGTAVISAKRFTELNGLVNDRPIIIDASMEGGVLAFEKTGVLTYA